MRSITSLNFKNYNKSFCLSQLQNSGLTKERLCRGKTFLASNENSTRLTTYDGYKKTYPVSFGSEQFNSNNICYKCDDVSSVPSLLAYMLKNTNNGNQNVSLIFSCQINDLLNSYKNYARQEISELLKRASQKGQVLNWIDTLPKTQLSRLDEIYTIAEKMKQNASGKLGVIGIGGSKHTIENLLSLNGLDENVVFLSAVDPISIEKFMRKLGDLKNVNILVASKSGTTLEPSSGYDYVEQAFVNKFKKDYMEQGMDESQAILKAREDISKHFVCVTDIDENKSKLRKIAQEKGYSCGVIHDDCGGRFGAFDDHSLISLAYSGMRKEDMQKMLEASLKAQKRYMNSDLTKNIAMQRAIFNVDCISKGKINQFDYYFGDFFEGTKLWNTQMKKESHKSNYIVSGDLLGPEFLHNSTEADLDSSNSSSFYTFNLLDNTKKDDYKSYNALINGSYKAYSERNPVSKVILKDLSPESIAEFIELKHFETIYTGMLLRTIKGEKHPDVLPEVLQPNVAIYKTEVQKFLSNNFS